MYYHIISWPHLYKKLHSHPRPESGIAIMILKDNIHDSDNEQTRNYPCLNDREKDVEINQSIIRLRNHIYYTLYVAEQELRSDRLLLKDGD